MKTFDELYHGFVVREPIQGVTEFGMIGGYYVAHGGTCALKNHAHIRTFTKAEAIAFIAADGRDGLTIEPA